MTVILGDELVPAMEELIDVLKKHDPVTQQKLLELLAARHALHMDSPKLAQFVADSMHKHTTSTIRQYWQGKPISGLDGQHRARAGKVVERP